MGEKDLDMIEKAHIAAERLEKANAELEKANKEKEALITRLEDVEKRLEVKRVLGGNSYAGGAPPREPTPEEKLKADMKNYFKGTAIEVALK